MSNPTSLIDHIVSGLQNYFTPQKPIISPLAGGSSLQNMVQSGASNRGNSGAANAIAMIRRAQPNNKLSDSQITSLYSKYGNKILQNIAPQKTASVVAPTPTSTPTPTPIPNFQIPAGTDQAMKYIQANTPSGVDPTSYYPALADKNFMDKLAQADKQKPGIANALLMTAFHESTLGRNGNNIFGVLPGGETSGRNASFNSPADALDYQLGPNVLGGGANKNMAVMTEPGPLTSDRLQQLYQSYNPEGAYINPVIQALNPNQGGN